MFFKFLQCIRIIFIIRKKSINNIYRVGIPLVVQWLRFHASTAGGAGSVPGGGIKSLHAHGSLLPPPKLVELLWAEQVIQLGMKQLPELLSTSFPMRYRPPRHLTTDWVRGWVTGLLSVRTKGFPDDSGKESTCQCRRLRRHRFDTWTGKISEEGNGNSLQYSCLKNPMDWGAWQAIVHGVTKTWTQLSDWALAHVD